MADQPAYDPPEEVLQDLEKQGATSHRGATLVIERHSALSTEELANWADAVAEKLDL